MRKAACFLLLLLSVLNTTGQNKEWLKQISTTDRVSLKDIATDSQGNIYLGGTFSQLLTIDKRSVRSNQGQDVFFARFHRDGNLSWIKAIKGTGDIWLSAITTDKERNFFLALEFVENVVVDSLHFLSSTGRDILLMKYNSNGKLLWAKHLAGVNNDRVCDVEADQYGNIYIAGSFTRQLSLDREHQLVSEGDNDLFIAKFNKSGQVEWAKRIVSDHQSKIQKLTTNNDSSIYITGKFTSTILFDDKTLQSRGNYDIFLAKFNTKGELQWSKSTGSSKNDEPVSLVVDNYGNALISGSFQADANFNGNSIESSRGYDIFISKYSSEGNFLWVAHIRGENGNERAGGLDVDIDGNIYITGQYDNKLVLSDGIKLESIKPVNYFAAQFNSDGQVQWARRISGANREFDQIVKVDLNKNVYIAGSFEGKENFGNLALDSGNGPGAYLRRIHK